MVFGWCMEQWLELGRWQTVCFQTPYGIMRTFFYRFDHDLYSFVRNAFAPP